jgi:replicative DNA helicase
MNSEQSVDNFNKIIDLIIAKQRNGPTGNIQLKFDKRRTKYLNI